MKYIVLIALQFCALFIYAQGHIEGKINDQKGLPLVGANIVLENTSLATTTEEEAQQILDALQQQEKELHGLPLSSSNILKLGSPSLEPIGVILWSKISTKVVAPSLEE